MADHMELSMESGGGGRPPSTPQISLVALFLACMVAGGVQYGWALQLSLLTPYVQVCKRVCTRACFCLRVYCSSENKQSFKCKYFVPGFL